MITHASNSSTELSVLRNGGYTGNMLEGWEWNGMFKTKHNPNLAILPLYLLHSASLDFMNSNASGTDYKLDT